MGAPKQKWTSEEESALKAGIVKHGAGKWRTILKDPEFSDVLSLRSNVDLKDKWRNMSVTANGWGSRERARLALKRSQQILRRDDNPMALSTVVKSFEGEIVDAEPLAMSNGTLQIKCPKRSIPRLDNLILEAITNLKESSGSNKKAIATYIKDQYGAPPNFKRLLSAKLKALTSSGKLIKLGRKYRIAPSSSFSNERTSGPLLLEGRQKEALKVEKDDPKPLTKSPLKVEKDDPKPLTKSQIDAELAKMRTMTAQEAAAAAAHAVTEAEAAMLEAEEAARDAEAAEADAEAAKAFAEAAMMTLKRLNASNLMVPGLQKYPGPAF
ncbi:telomere repeat-binding factor 1-like [Tasmannia lanceolata]|uniref:telomere repeat-binding factor 1-like n=1 Tax=Tasmannia lanceolata TaxID=3420 RepID=UPI0040639EAF